MIIIITFSNIAQQYQQFDFTDANVCDPSLCQNNATCNDHFDFFNFFNCSCVPGYTGALCETGNVKTNFG